MADPPVCPPGWTTGPPDFVGVGMQRAGTSWWHSLLVAHPQVHELPGARKEVHFFDRYCSNEFTAADAALYHRYFPRPPGGRAGDWTPRYLYDFWVLDLLRAAAPDARILVLLRDPIERYRSAVSYRDAAMRRKPDRRGFGGRVDAGVRNPELATGAFNRGFYSAQLRRLLDRYPREQVLVLQYERCRQDPAGELQRTYSFVGLDGPEFRPDGFLARVNATRGQKKVLPGRVVDTLRTLYEDDVRRLAKEFPEIDLSLWPHFRHLVDGG